MPAPTRRFPIWMFIMLAGASISSARAANEQRNEQRFFESQSNEGFGEATAISGDWAMIAAPWSSAYQGRVEVYRRQAGLWGATQSLRSPTPQGQSLFGSKLALSGDWLAVSQPESVNGPDNQRGSVHLYHRSLESWSFVQTLRGAQTGADFYCFGDGLDLEGGTLAVTTDVIRGDERSSSVRLYRLRAASWELDQTLENITTRVNQVAVLSMKLHGNTLALGNPWRLGNEGWNVGEVQIFRHQSGTTGRWKHEQTLLTDPKAGAHRLGETVGFTDAGELLATSNRSLWSSSWNGQRWSQPANVEINGNEAPLANASTNDMRVSGSVAAVFLNGLRLLRRTESGWHLMHTLETGLVVPPLAVSEDTVLFRSQWGYSVPETVSFVPLMDMEIRLGATTTHLAASGQNDEMVKPGSVVTWRPWIEGAALPLHVRNAGPSLLPFPTAQLSGAAAALFEIVGPAAASTLLAADAEAAFELRVRSTLPQTDQTLTVTFSTGGAVPDYAFQVIWKSDTPQSFAAAQVSLPPAVIHPKGQRLILTPSVNGSQAMTYRWLREGITVPGQTRASLDLASLRPEDAGYYQVEVKSGTHTVFSNNCELVVFEPQSGVIPLRDDQSARLTTKVWGRAYIKWLSAWESPYLFGLNSPTLTIMNGRYLRDDPNQEELSAVAVVGNYQGVPLAESEVARFTLRSVGRVPRLYPSYVFDRDYLVGDQIDNEASFYPVNAVDMNGLNLGFPGSVLRATGLPPGIILDSATGNLSGTFSKAGVYQVTWTLTDFIGRKSSPFVSTFRVGQSPIAARAGIYAGTITGDDVTPDLKLGMGGYLELNMEETGIFSGLLRVDAGVRRFASSLKQVTDSPENYECELQLLPLPGSKTTRLMLKSVPSASAVTAEVVMEMTDGGTVTLDTTRSFTLSFRARGAKLVGPDLVGRYSALLGGSMIEGSGYQPQGSGFMSVQMSSGSTATVVGSLVDGTGFTCACPVLDRVGSGKLSLPLYLHATGQGSTLAGELAVDTTGSLSLEVDLRWRQIAKAGARLYPGGFIMALLGNGGRYIMPPAGHTLLAHGPDAPGNAIFSSDPLNIELESTLFRLTADHRALLPRSAPGLNHVTRIDFYAPTGFFTGEIILEPTIGEGEKRIPGGRVGFRGMMIPQQGLGGGYYHRRSIFLSEGPFVSRGVSIWRGL